MCSEIDIWSLTSHLTRALVYLHGRGIIHGNLKPENLFTRFSHVEDNTEMYNVKIGDFGVTSLLTKAAMTKFYTGGILENPTYVAPEVLWVKINLLPLKSLKVLKRQHFAFRANITQPLRTSGL